jgi:hypothetical protein
LLESVQFVLSEDGTVQLAGVSAPLGLLISYIWSPRGHFDPFMLFSRFIVSLSILRYRLFGARMCVSP